MNKLLVGVMLGVATGLVVSQVPEIKDLLAKGKKKVKQLSK